MRTQNFVSILSVLGFFILLQEAFAASSGSDIFSPAEQTWLQHHQQVAYEARQSLPAVSITGEDCVNSDCTQGFTADLLVLLHLNHALPRFTPSNDGQALKPDVIGAVTKASLPRGYMLTEAYLIVPSVMIMSPQREALTKGMRLAVPEDSFDVANIAHAYPELELLPVPDHTTAIGMALYGLTDAALTYDAARIAITEAFNRSSNNSGVVIAASNVLESQAPPIEFHFAVREDNDELVSILNKALQTLSPEQLQDLNFRWQKKELSTSFWQQYSPSQRGLIIAVVLVILMTCVVVFLWVKLRLTHQQCQTANALNHELEATLATLQTTDPVTGIANRAAWLDEATKELTRYHRYGNNFAVLLLAVDELKNVRQEFGQQVADDIMIYLVNSLKEQLRDHDMCGRMASDELAILLHGVTPELADKVATRISQQMNDRGYSSALGEHPVSVRTGIALPRVVSVNIDEILTRAENKRDQA